MDEAGTTIAVANKATGDVTFFDRESLNEKARVAVGEEPVSLSFSPDGSTLFVVNRLSQNVSIVSGANGDSPSVSSTIAVGSEPGQGALSPTGATLYVSNWSDGTLSIIDTATGAVTSTIELGGAPYAVCVTNDGDADDQDETIFVTDFYSRPDGSGKEGTDGSRVGRVFKIDAANNAVDEEILLEPIAVKGINAEIDAANTSAFANQLYSCAVNKDHLYVTSVGASPAPFDGGTDFHQNLHGLVYAVNLSDSSVDADRSVNLSELVTPLAGEKRFAAVPHDIAFVPGTDLGYIASMTSNSVLRVDFGQSPPVAGAASGANFLATAPSPTGLTILGSDAYVYNEVGRSISHLDLVTQTTKEASIASADQPSGSAADELRGQKFFNTGLARWSTAAWVGCVGCHPFGTTDNVTWIFPAGPRQTIDTSATFDKSGNTQRILNWSAIFDEVHDFELNTRGVAGGVGAIVSDADLDTDNRINFVGPGGVANPKNGFNVGSVLQLNKRIGAVSDWDDIESYIKTIRTPEGRSADDASIADGKAVFEEGNCGNCHGNVLWTLSERYYTPIENGDLRLVTFADEGITDLGGVRADQTSLDEIGFENAGIIGNDGNGPPQRHLCTVRIVGTFGEEGPKNRGADELRQNGGNAQGVDGFNVPSLLGINTGAPYLHNGAAENLAELLDPQGKFVTHLQAGNQIFVPSETQIINLIAYLRSIDEDTETIAIPDNQNFCPTNIVPPVAP